MDWKEKAKECSPIILEHMQRLVENGKGASPDVTRALVGMLLRGDEPASGAAPVVAVADTAPARVEDDSAAESVEDDDDSEDDLAPCEVCEGSGQVTLDEFVTPLPRVLAEIERDKSASPDSQSRTEAALATGALKLTGCDACGGSGSIRLR